MVDDSTPPARAEQQFFADPAIDCLMGALMALATEHYVLRDRLRALEQELAKAGSVATAALDRGPDEAEIAANRADAEAFVAALLKPLLGVQDACGASGVISLKKVQRERSEDG
jgi:hypothetical protein